MVAQEVKTLAEQTTKATAEVGAQINDIQATTQRAAENISTIVRTTERANTIARSIAESVYQQGEATKEIAANVQHASQGAQQVAENIGGVLEAAQSSSDRLQPHAGRGRRSLPASRDPARRSGMPSSAPCARPEQAARQKEAPFPGWFDGARHCIMDP